MTIHFFGNQDHIIYAVATAAPFEEQTIEKLSWLFGNVPLIEKNTVSASFIGPRAAMITPWSTNAVEITQNMGIQGIIRIELFENEKAFKGIFDPMLFQKYSELNATIFDVHIQPEPIQEIENIAEYNQKEGLALSDEEVAYLNSLSEKLGRKLTDSEVFGFSQVNSEHCRHKIFNGTFVIDGETKEKSLFQWIKTSAAAHPNKIVSAYKDNVAFLEGPKAVQFAPASADKPDFYKETAFESVISVKAETHNFPTTVEPFNGAATGSGGEIRDRLAGGQGSIPLAGTAVYMTAYTRAEQNRMWEQNIEARPWLYQTPLDILIKASNGASDFGNKFGQPLICGSVYTFEHQENNQTLGFDKVIMLAGGVGYGKKEQAKKKAPSQGDAIVVLGGENYRIGMGGAAVSSADTGALGSGIELNAIQRSNPEMQKRAANTIRALVESDTNPIVSIHDHGAGGHLNCLSELVDEIGGHINLDALPVGDPTLSAKEIIGNESQERMGLVVHPQDIDTLKVIAERERTPMYEVGVVSGDHTFKISSKKTGATPMNLGLDDMFGSSPKTIMEDRKKSPQFAPVSYSEHAIYDYVKALLQMEAVACKDWLTNKVDRCVGGRVAKQQNVGAFHLPLNNVGVMALDYKGTHGIATSIGHASAAALIDAAAGSRLAIAEALTNIVFAPIQEGIKGVSLSANWMWPCKNPGEDARLYEAVEACAQFAIALGINIPTGKDSLSMKQKYPNQDVLAPGTVIISAVGHTDAISKVIEPVLQANGGDLYYLNLSQSAFALGGSAFAQLVHKVGDLTPDVSHPEAFKKAFDFVQDEIRNGNISAGHDIGSGGLITSLLELCFANPNTGAQLDFSSFNYTDDVTLLFNENPGLILQGSDDLYRNARALGVDLQKIGTVVTDERVSIKTANNSYTFDVNEMRRQWFYSSYLMDKNQTPEHLAKERFEHVGKQALEYHFPKHFDGKLPLIPSKRPKAAVIREKGSNSEREMAHAFFLAGFDVKDVHMTDLISGRETLEDIQMIGFVGGFSNSDVLGSAKGWAGAFKYNPRAQETLQKFYARPDTLSVGICNGCQLMMELELLYPEHQVHGKMHHNFSNKHESGFVSVTIQPNHSVMMSSLAGATLGVWISHGEGRFVLPEAESAYHIVGKYTYEGYPANPNGSDYQTAFLSDASGRHLVMMPHIERSIFQWNWPYYQNGRQDEVSPWLEAFVNARNWLNKQ